MDTDAVSRTAIPKRIRFEVFKRDSFKCQYCGATAPDVLLEIDHIKAVASGGTNDITNLIVACQACNSGKSDKPLDENTAVAKSRTQLEQLQERREQLEMMMAWQEGLRDIKLDAADRVCAYWIELAPGWSVSDTGRQKLRKWIRDFSVEEVCRAMDTAAEQYLRFNDDGTVTQESWEVAFGKIPGVCRVERESKDNPDIRDLYYIRGIARKRIGSGWFDNAKALEWLQAARSWGVPIAELRSIANHTTGWRRFFDDLSQAIEKFRPPAEPESSDEFGDFDDL